MQQKGQICSEQQRQWWFEVMTRASSRRLSFLYNEVSAGMTVASSIHTVAPRCSHVPVGHITLYAGVALQIQVHNKNECMWAMHDLSMV